MNILRTAKLSIRGMLANKLRTMLSSLGIIIGVFSVVVLLAIGEGAQKSILSNIEALGTNLLTITPGSQNQSNVRSFGGSNRNIFTMDHSNLIATLSWVTAVAPAIQTSGQVIFGSENTNATIYGVTPEYESVRNIKTENGSFITAKNQKNREKVAVIGPTIVTNIFGGKDPIGQTIRIGNALFTVVGVTESKWSSAGWNQDSTIYIPITTAIISLVGSPYLSSISVSVESTEKMDEVKTLIENRLMEYLWTTSDNMKFTVQSQEDMLETASSITGILKGFLTGIAAISLIVWWIGVMNILLVTVTERTK